MEEPIAEIQYAVYRNDDGTVSIGCRKFEVEEFRHPIVSNSDWSEYGQVNCYDVGEPVRNVILALLGEEADYIKIAQSDRCVAKLVQYGNAPQEVLDWMMERILGSAKSSYVFVCGSRHYESLWHGRLMRKISEDSLYSYRLLWMRPNEYPEHTDMLLEAVEKDPALSGELLATRLQDLSSEWQERLLKSVLKSSSASGMVASSYATPARWRGRLFKKIAESPEQIVDSIQDANTPTRRKSLVNAVCKDPNQSRRLLYFKLWAVTDDCIEPLVMAVAKDAQASREALMTICGIGEEWIEESLLKHRNPIQLFTTKNAHRRISDEMLEIMISKAKELYQP